MRQHERRTVHVSKAAVTQNGLVTGLVALLELNVCFPVVVRLDLAEVDLGRDNGGRLVSSVGKGVWW